MKNLLDDNGYTEALLRKNFPPHIALQMIDRLKGEDDEPNGLIQAIRDLQYRVKILEHRVNTGT